MLTFLFIILMYFLTVFFAPYIPRHDYPGMPENAPQKQWSGQCGAPTCMQTLAINLGVVMGFNLVLGTTVELAIPYVS